MQCEQINNLATAQVRKDTPSLIDVTGLGRPKEFTGREEDFQQWSKKMEAFKESEMMLEWALNRRRKSRRQQLEETVAVVTLLPHERVQQELQKKLAEYRRRAKIGVCSVQWSWPFENYPSAADVRGDA